MKWSTGNRPHIAGPMNRDVQLEYLSASKIVIFLVGFCFIGFSYTQKHFKEIFFVVLSLFNKLYLTNLKVFNFFFNILVTMHLLN